MADHRHTTFFALRCEELSRHGEGACVLAIGRPWNCNDKCVSGGQRPERTTTIELIVLKCCSISDWQSKDSNPSLVEVEHWAFQMPDTFTGDQVVH